MNDDDGNLLCIITDVCLYCQWPHHKVLDYLLALEHCHN